VDIKQALNKAAALCSASEKCADDIRQKLITWDILPDDATKIIDQLKREKFIDHERFTSFYVRDKFKFNKWGRIKIRYELRKKGIETTIINDALDSIDEETYLDALETILKAKHRQSAKADAMQQKAALVRFGASRGFEPDLCFRVAERVLKG
jgi:regulatory protein